MTVSICPYPRFKAWYPATGTPLAGGQLYTYQPGTTTAKPSYTSSTGGTTNPDPVILDANGEADVWLNGFYKLVLYDPVSNLIWGEDNVSSSPAQISALSQWIRQAIAVTYVSSTQFTCLGDQTGIFQVGIAIQATVSAGTAYGTVTASSFVGGLTTVTCLFQSGTGLDSGLSAISTGVITVANTSLPIFPVVAKTSNYALVEEDINQILFANSANATSFTLLLANQVPSGSRLQFRNIGAGTLTLIGTVDGVANQTLAQGQEITIYSNGANYYTAVPLFANSLVKSNTTVSLANDSASPGANKFYGTDANGNRGYQNFSIQTNNIANFAVTRGVEYFNANGFTIANTTEVEIGTVTSITNTANDSVWLWAQTSITQFGANTAKGNMTPVSLHFRIRRSNLSGTEIAGGYGLGFAATGAITSITNPQPVVLIGSDEPANSGGIVYKLSVQAAQTPDSQNAIVAARTLMALVRSK